MDLISLLRSSDTNERDAALAQLIEMGSAALPVLRVELSRPGCQTRPALMEALASIAHSSSAKDFHAALEDGDERVRAWAAAGLARIKDAGAIPALIRTFDDQAVDLPGPHTLSSSALVEVGPAALAHVVPLLNSPNALTRERAYWVIATIVTRMDDYRNRWQELSHRLGDYDVDGTAESRNESVRKWEAWVARIRSDRSA